MKRNFPHPIARLLSAGLFTSLAIVPSLVAQSTWSGLGADANWSTGANWDVPIANSFSTGLIFAGSTKLTNTNDLTGGTATSIAFNSGAGAFILGGNDFTLGGNIVNSSTSLQTINNNLATTAVRTVTLTTGGGDVNLGGVISGTAGGLATAGAGTLTLSGANTYTGATTIGVGTTIKVGNASALGATTGALTLGGSASNLDLNGFSVTKGAYNSTVGSTVTNTGLGTSTFTVGSGNAATVLGNTTVSGDVKLVITGTGTTGTLANTNTHTGGTTIQNRISTATGNASVRINAAGFFGTGAITLDNGAIQNTTAGLTFTNNIVITNSFNYWNVRDTNLTGSWSGSGTLRVDQQFNAGLVVGGDMTGFSGTLNFQNGGTTGNNTSTLSFTNTAASVAGSASAAFTQSAVVSGNTGTNTIQWNGIGDRTIALGDLSTATSFTSFTSGTTQVRNNAAGTTATYSVGALGNNSTYAGNIVAGNGVTALTKVGTGTWTLSGTNNTYTGATTVNAGKLNITGALNGTGPVTVNGGAKLGGLGNGTTTGIIAGAVTVAAGSTAPTQGTISLVDGTIGTLTLTSPSGLTAGGSAGNSSNLNFEANSSTADLINLGANPFNLDAGGATITITSLGVTANQTYSLMTFGSGTGAGFSIGSGVTVGGLTLSNPALSFGVSATLNVTATTVQLVTTGASAAATAYWSGAQGNQWASNNGVNGNFTTDLAGTNFVHAYPAATTDVFFAGTGATNLTNTLGTSFDIKSLTFLNGTGAVTINGDGNTLTIESGGLTVQSGAGAVSIGANIAGPGAVTTAGTLTLSGANTYSGGTTITAGTTTLGSATALGTGALAVQAGTLDLNGKSVSVAALSGNSGAIITNNNAATDATLSENNAADTTFAGVLTDGSNGKVLALGKGGAGTLILTGANTYSGGTTVNTGTLQLGSTTAMGSGSVTVNSGATIDLNGQTITNTISAITGTGNGGVGALVNNSATAAAITSVINNANRAFTVGGTGDIALDTVTGTNGLTVNKVSTNQLTLGGTADNSFLALNVNGGTVLLNKSGIAGSHAVNILTLTSGTVKYGTNTATGGTLGGQTNQLIINGGTVDLNGASGQNAGVTTLSGTGGVVTNTNATPATLTVGYNNAISTYSGVIQDGVGQVAFAKVGTGTTTLAGINTYTGNTTVNAGTLVLGASGGLNFVIGANGVNNKITGAGAVTLDGTFTFDLSGASSAPGNSWTIVDATTKLFDPSFNVTGFTETSDVWTNGTYTFTEATGVLSTAAVPEPGTMVLLSSGLGLLMIVWRARRRSAI